MAHYLLNVIQPDGDPPPPEVLGPIMANVAALNAEIKQAGAWVFSAGLAPASSATVVKVRDDELSLTDGPYVEAKEHIGGFTIITAPDLDAALAWARKFSAAITLPIEVRPISQFLAD